MTFKKTFIDKSGAFIYVTRFFIKLYNLVGLERFNFSGKMDYLITTVNTVHRNQIAYKL